MSTSTASSASESSSSTVRITKLDESGENWLLYSRQLKSYVIGRGLKQYLSGEAAPPKRPVEGQSWIINMCNILFLSPFS